VQEAICEADQLLAAVRAGLAERVGPTRTELWFGQRTRLRLQDDRLAVEAPNEFYRDFLRRNFRDHLHAATEAVLGREVILEFLVGAPVADAGTSSPQSELPFPSPRAASPDATVPEAAVPVAAAPPAAARPPVGATFRRRPLAELGSFVVGPSNRLAFASAELAAGELGRYSPLCLHGPTGVGKTHLLEGICAAASRQERRICAVYQTAEQFTTEFLEALRQSGLPSFRRKYRGVDLLVLDDVQFLTGKRATLAEMFHTLDTLLRQGRQVVLAADRAPAELTDLGPELSARVCGGMACRIAPPEYEVRLGIVRQAAERMELELPDGVAASIAARFSQHARQLMGAVHRLKAVCEAHGEPVTCALADEALADLAAPTARTLRLADIERAVCDEFRLEGDALRSRGKELALSHPRALAMWLARKHTRSALSEIGSYFGRRSHTTVLAAQRRVEAQMGNPVVGKRHTGKSLEDTIRRVEQRLRVG
jgi:chromosomal replication initiator protein